MGLCLPSQGVVHRIGPGLLGPLSSRSLGSEQGLPHPRLSAAKRGLKGSPEGSGEPENPGAGGTLHFLCSNRLQQGVLEHWSSVIASSGRFQVTACIRRETHPQAGAVWPLMVHRALPHLGLDSASLTRPFRGPGEAVLSCGHPQEPLQGCQDNTPSPPFIHTYSGRAWASGVLEAPQVTRMAAGARESR